PRLRQASAKVEQARAEVGIASSSLFPSLSAGVGSSRGDKYGFGTSHSNKYSTVSGDWTVDLFGAKHAQKRAAEAKLAAAISDQTQAENELLASIASTYVDVRYYQRRIQISERHGGKPAAQSRLRAR
ncbi:MAG: TolC family protein, partial [Mesorhizobium sp.]